MKYACSTTAASVPLLRMNEAVVLRAFSKSSVTPSALPACHSHTITGAHLPSVPRQPARCQCRSVRPDGRPVRTGSRGASVRRVSWLAPHGGGAFWLLGRGADEL